MKKHHDAFIDKLQTEIGEGIYNKKLKHIYSHNKKIDAVIRTILKK